MNIAHNKRVKFVSMADALKDVTPIPWSDDVISGRKKVVVKEVESNMIDIFQIKLDVNDVGDFVNIAQGISNDINLCQGRTVVSGKSIMGVMSLDLSKPIDLLVRDRENDDIIYSKFSRYLFGRIDHTIEM